VIVGVGIDVVDVDRFTRVLERTPRLRERLFTPIERDLPVVSLAARFAAKEAVAKALGGPTGLRWLDVTVPGGRGERPELRVTGTVAACADRLGVGRFHLSLSHDGGVATAMVVAETDGPGGSR
jgi:holo-[acyl-carrier protein] synthase